MKIIHPVDFNKTWAKTKTRKQFIEILSQGVKQGHDGVDYGAEYDKIVPPKKVEDKKAIKA